MGFQIMKIKLLAMDVDGTLTDGRLFIGNSGELMKAFDVKDGYAIVQFRKKGGIPVVITGRKSKIVENRCRELGITELYQNVEDKLECLKIVVLKHCLSQDRVAYIGDDLNDLACINYSEIGACPNDAVLPVKNVATYVCKTEGGRGAVREFIDYLSSLDES